MQQIADWLEKLGMSEYAERFAENDIDISVLRDLTDQDLKELGVSLGHRRKMLRAIAELAGAAPTSPQPASDGAEDPRHRRAPPSHGDVLGPWSARRHYRPAWTLKTCARSFRPIRSASRRPWVASAGSSRSTWATASWSISAIRRRMRTTQSGPCARGWSWSLR